jgi:hypothetical protein
MYTVTDSFENKTIHEAKRQELLAEDDEDQGPSLN